MKRLAMTLAGLLVCLPAQAVEQEGNAEQGKPAASEQSPSETPKRVLTPEELAEKEARKACKKKICDIIGTRDPEGEDIACDIVKMLGGRINWPWGKAVCQSRLELKRKPLALAMSEAQYEVDLPAQKVRCTIAQKTEGEPY